MQMWMTLLLVLQLLTAIVMIGLVLLQHGKGADVGASFGGGSSGSLFGASGSANFLSRSTAVCAAVFFIATLGLAFMADTRVGGAARDIGGGSVLDRAVTEPEPAPGAIPGQAPIPAPSAAPAPGAESTAPGQIPTR